MMAAWIIALIIIYSSRLTVQVPAQTDIPIELFTGTTFIEKFDLLPYRSTLPIFFKIPLVLNETNINNTTSNLHCQIDKNSTQCLIEDNLNNLKQALNNQLHIQALEFFESIPNDKLLLRKLRSIRTAIGHALNYCCGTVVVRILTNTQKP